MEAEEINWSVLVEEWQGSDLSQSKFCRDHGVSYERFRHHLKKSGWQPAQRRMKKSPSSFVEVRPAAVVAKKVEFLTIAVGSEGCRVKLNLDLRF